MLVVVVLIVSLGVAVVPAASPESKNQAWRVIYLVIGALVGFLVGRSSSSSDDDTIALPTKCHRIPADARGEPTATISPRAAAPRPVTVLPNTGVGGQEVIATLA